MKLRLLNQDDLPSIRRVKNVPRLPADIRISLKKHGEKTYRIELIRQSTGRRFLVLTSRQT